MPNIVGFEIPQNMDLSAVYIFVNDEQEVRYVGETGNYIARIQRHNYESYLDFMLDDSIASVIIIRCESNDRIALEVLMSAIFNPPEIVNSFKLNPKTLRSSSFLELREYMYHYGSSILDGYGELKEYLSSLDTVTVRRNKGWKQIKKYKSDLNWEFYKLYYNCVNNDSCICYDCLLEKKYLLSI